jgi:NADPH2:quinone reductase
MDDFRMLIRRTGGPEVIEREDIAASLPGPGEVRVRHRAIGLNFIDTYRRSGLYPIELPAGMGTEAAGVIEAVGEGVGGFAPGDRVAYATGPVGAYATVRTMPAADLIHLPDDIGDEIAAAAMLKGLTAAFLIELCAKVQPGDAVLVHAAAGGVGSILVPWLKAIGAVTIAHAGSPEKAARAADLGATHALSCPMDDLAGDVRALTGGRGVPVVLDGVGKASWQASLGSVARRGLIVTYGNASGPVPPIDALALMKAGSIFVTRPTMGDYMQTPEDRRALADRLFAMMRRGVTVPIGLRLPLGDAKEAHRRLESRQTTGATILLP